MIRLSFASMIFTLVLVLPAGDVAWCAPDPATSTVPNVLIDPGGTLGYTVSVRDPAGAPVVGAVVAISFSTAVDSLLCWCPGQAHPLVTAITDGNGEASFHITAGGCIDPDSVAVPLIEVFADGVKLAEVGAVSPDAVDDAARFPWQGWSPPGTCMTGLSDAVRHSASIKIRQYSFCTDFDSDGRITLTDAVLVTIPIRQANTCP